MGVFRAQEKLRYSAKHSVMNQNRRDTIETRLYIISRKTFRRISVAKNIAG